MGTGWGGRGVGRGVRGRWGRSVGRCRCVVSRLALGQQPSMEVGRMGVGVSVCIAVMARFRGWRRCCAARVNRRRSRWRPIPRERGREQVFASVQTVQAGMRWLLFFGLRPLSSVTVRARYWLGQARPGALGSLISNGSKHALAQWLQGRSSWARHFLRPESTFCQPLLSAQAGRERASGRERESEWGRRRDCTDG